MSLRSLPLRLKLALALVLPMLLVTVLIGDRIKDSVDDRGRASIQNEEALRLETFADFANDVGAESVVTNDPTASVEQLQAARARTDATLERLQDSSLGFDPEVIRSAGDHHGELVAIRELVGDRPADISLRFQLEAYVDPKTADGETSDATESLPSALGRLAKLPTTIAAEFEFADAAVVDVETARLLADYDLVQRLRDDHVQEVSVLLQLASTPPSLVDGAALETYRTHVADTDVSRSLIYDFGGPDVVADIWASRRSAAGAEYSTLRAAADRTGPGIERVDDIAAINRSGSVVAAQYTVFSDEVVNSIRAQAESTAGAASVSLMLVLLAGAWMLVVAFLVLGLLYRSIRAPLQRLTEQSQHIATVELPYVVSAMRKGLLDEAPTTTDLVADANDEIGELVQAFNDMHRTAVELAAEQAGARRVVADMFVNLGRRNQRLVNRLLKRLSTLEQDERDPDKLAGLYEIDHVVTRMRRNAESLLVLAGADQSRKFDRPVEIYDIARGALSEVEGYERVEIVADADFEIHGDVVADLTHLLAELVENALSFSPPSTAVAVALRRIGDDHLVSVSDIGVGMTDVQLAEVNERIWSAGTEEETPSEFLGHYVIGRLAARHRIDVRLTTGTGGRGTVADVLIPVGAVVLEASEIVEGFENELRDSSTSSSNVPIAAEAAQPTPASPAPLAATASALAEDSRPDWSNVEQQVRRPVPPEAPASRPAPTPAPVTVAPVATLRPEVTTPSVPPATPTPSSSFEYPPTDQIDPRQREVAPRPAVTAETPAAPVSPLPAAVPPTPASGAGDDALTAFGSARRTPGASLPDTSLIASIAGRMTLEITPPAGTEPAATEPFTAPTIGPLTTPHTSHTPSPPTSPTPDPEEIRSQLSGFQSGTRRADREN